MAYDGLDRLTKVVSPMFANATDSEARYRYDALDNLVTVHVRDRHHFYCHDANNRLTNIKTNYCDTGPTVIGLGYDVQGNLQNKNGQEFRFDYGNRLRSAVGKESYRYDGHGRRVLARSEQGQGVIRSLYGNDGVLLPVGRPPAEGVQHIYLAGSLIATRETPYNASVNTIKYQHTDALGSPVAVTDSNRTVIERFEYEPYGKIINPASPKDGPGYTGHVYDSATGLNYMQQRYCDPLCGCFLSVDPVTAYEKPGQNFNRYWYTNNNPYRFKDPDGRLACSPGDNRCRDQLRERERRGIPSWQSGSSGVAKHRSGCDTSECDEVKNTRSAILRQGGERLKEAGAYGAKEGAIMLGGGFIGKALGKLGRLFGIGGKAGSIPFRSDTSHIFRSARGHLGEDTPANRALLQGVVRPENMVGTRGPGGSISVYRETLSDGRQVWVEVRNGTEITNGGVNLTPRP